MESEFRRYAREAFRQMDDPARHPTTTQISEYLRGEMPAQGRAELERHLAACAACARSVEEFREFLGDVGKPAPRDTGREYEEVRQRIRRRAGMPPAARWGAIAAGVVVAAGVSWVAWQELRPNPGRLLAQAYQEQRTSEFRLAGAAFAPVRQERAGNSAFSRPAPLLKAEAWLAERLKESAEDPVVLRLRGEAEMMGRDAGAAVQTLERARDLRPQDARILADLGVAYALRGDAERDSRDSFSAIDCLSRSLHLDANNREAEFNLALALEKSLQYDQALLQWQAYLKMDAAGPWAAEARQHLAAVQEKIQAREKALKGVVSDPREFLRLAAAGPVDVEAYLRDRALPEWLPRAASDGAARDALARLAALLAEHGDRWLADVLATGVNANLSEAFGAIAEADRLMNAGDTRAALDAVARADGLFRKPGNPAARFRAGLSRILSLKNSQTAEAAAECRETAAALDRQLQALPYPWMRARIDIEYGVCSLRTGQLGEGAELFRRAIRMADAGGFNDTALRARHMLLTTMGPSGLPSDVFATARQGIEEFWRGAHGGAPYYAIADELRLTAANSGEPYAALWLARSAVWAAQSASSAILEAPARVNLAAAAQAVENATEARENLARGEQLYAGLPGGYRVGPQAALAELEMRSGNVAGALARLDRLRPDVDAGPTANSVMYYGLLGEGYRRAKRSDEALAAFQKSIDTGKARLESVPQEREKSGLIRAIAPSIRGTIAIRLERSAGDESALRIWQDFRALDGGMPAKAEHATLWFAELPDRFVGWLEQDGHIEPHAIEPGKATLASTVRRFARECSDSRTPERAAAADGRQLYEWLIKPFERQLRQDGGPLLLELDGDLTAIPVQALAAADGRYLADEFPLLIARGVERQAGARSIGTASRVTVVANPTIGGESASHFPSLPDSVREAEVIRSIFPATTVLEGPRASIGALEAALPSADIVHFAGHGYSTSENGALLFAAADPGQADYDLLRAGDLRKQEWSRCRLAVLSACATAAGETRGAHNPESLVRALARAGVRRVAASLWNVDSAATAELMRAFYGSLAQGEEPENALRNAQRRIRQQPGRAHPYYWASFQMYGTT